MALCRQMYDAEKIVLREKLGKEFKVADIPLDERVVACTLYVAEVVQVPRVSEVIEVDYKVLVRVCTHKVANDVRTNEPCTTCDEKGFHEGLPLLRSNSHPFQVPGDRQRLREVYVLKTLRLEGVKPGSADSVLMSEPLVSILLPAYNAAPYVRLAVSSIQAQTYENWELLVCDDCSSDDTRTILDSFQDPRIKRYHNRKNLGYLRTCNRLFELSGGELLTFQDADDVSLPTRLEAQVQELVAEPGLDLIGSWATIIDSSGRVLRTNQQPVSYQDIREQMYRRNCFCGATMMLRRQVYEAVGGYREFFEDFGAEDYDWSCLIAESFTCRNLPQALYQYRIHPLSLSRSPNPKRAVAHRLVQHLALQRKERQGYDDLILEKHAELNDFVNLILEPHIRDVSKIYRSLAGVYMYEGLWIHAITSSLAAIRTRPFSLVNWRTLFYCLRKSLVAEVSKLWRRR